MSKPKAARDRLFKYGRPNIRPLDIIEDGGIGKDMAILWAAYRKGSMPDWGELTQEQFTDKVLELISEQYSVWIAEDKNYHYPNGYGPVGLIAAHFNGWIMEPHFMPFSWATKRNRLKVNVAFMQMARYEKGIGIITVNSKEENKDFFFHLWKKYRVIYYVGFIKKGNFGEDNYLFYGRGGSFFKSKEPKGVRNEPNR